MPAAKFSLGQHGILQDSNDPKHAVNVVKRKQHLHFWIDPAILHGTNLSPE